MGCTKHIEVYIKTEINKKEIIEKIIEIFPHREENEQYIFEGDSFNFIKTHVFYYNNDRFIVFDKNFFITLTKKYNPGKHLYILDQLPEYPQIVNDTYKKFIIDTINEVETKKNYPTWFNDNNKDINYDNIENLNFIRSELLSGKSIYDISKNRNVNNCISIDYWIFRGWDEQTAKLKISEIQKLNSIKSANKKKENPEWTKEISNTCVEYWMKKGYSLEEAKIKLKERQRTFSFKKCIEKYGEKKGLEIFQDRQKRWQKTLMCKEDYLDIISRRQNNKGYSNISQEFFDAIYEKIKSLNLNVYYAKLNHEYGIGIKNRRGCLYDFVITDIKYAIEFNGIKFHPRKDKLSENEWNNWKAVYTNKSADEVYKLDLEKNLEIINHGFILDIIWDEDYLKDKENIINSVYNKIINLYEKYRNSSQS